MHLLFITGPIEAPWKLIPLRPVNTRLDARVDALEGGPHAYVGFSLAAVSTLSHASGELFWVFFDASIKSVLRVEVNLQALFILSENS